MFEIQWTHVLHAILTFAKNSFDIVPNWLFLKLAGSCAYCVSDSTKYARFDWIGNICKPKMFFYCDNTCMDYDFKKLYMFLWIGSIFLHAKSCAWCFSVLTITVLVKALLAFIFLIWRSLQNTLNSKITYECVQRHFKSAYWSVKNTPQPLPSR